METMAGRVHVAKSIEDAQAAVSAGAAPLAGATWIMRAPIRREPFAPRYVALSRVPSLRAIEIGAREIRIGACATHAEIAGQLAFPDCAGLAAAAAHSANPSIRNIATIGGNLCASAFPASDLAPALLSLDAAVDVLLDGREERLPVADFLAARSRTRGLALRFVAARSARPAAHVRLPLRKAGDYPVAIVSVSAEIRRDRLEDVRIAVGSVEPAARRWARLEQALAGSPLSSSDAFEKAQGLADDFKGRDSVEAAGWYRVKVLPILVQRAFEALGRSDA
jgi:aerobic carbon-monoxide dehydrogenase medium subunit